MRRPDDRPLRRLPTLEASKATLERCVFCPKLCRSACPVSNAEPRETLTPWGKMSMAYFAANGSVPIAPSYAAPAWACTGCFGCREHCDHKNDVTGTLYEARSALIAEGHGPAGALKVIAEFEAKAQVLARTCSALESLPNVRAEASTALLVGCGYARAELAELQHDAVRATAKLTGGPVAITKVCCGAPLLYAGDAAGFRRQGERLAEAVKDKHALIVLDAGCATAIRVHHASNGQSLAPSVEHFTELAARNLSMLAPVAQWPAGPLRYHDPCQLGRGLGVYDEPRAILARAFGRPADEFARCRRDARCSGAGGLLPLTMPEVSRHIADARIEEHEELGGGTIVTACASSQRRFRTAGANTLDLVTVVARALGVHEA